MTKDPIEAHIVSLIRTSFPGRPVTSGTDLVRDLDADSMAMVSLIFAIDEEFAVGTDQLGEMVQNCRTVGDLVSATEKLMRERAPAS